MDASRWDYEADGNRQCGEFGRLIQTLAKHWRSRRRSSEEQRNKNENTTCEIAFVSRFEVSGDLERKSLVQTATSSSDHLLSCLADADSTHKAFTPNSKKTQYSIHVCIEFWVLMIHRVEVRHRFALFSCSIYYHTHFRRKKTRSSKIWRVPRHSMAIFVVPFVHE